MKINNLGDTNDNPPEDLTSDIDSSSDELFLDNKPLKSQILTPNKPPQWAERHVL